jgi:hypothetical protein
MLSTPIPQREICVIPDEEVLAWIQKQAAGSRYILSVCTGALLCGAAGLLKGRRATTDWSSLYLLPFFGAIPLNERVVVDANYVFAATAEHLSARRRRFCNTPAKHIRRSPLGERKPHAGSQLVSAFLSPNERLAKSEGLLAILPTQPPLHCPSC